MLIFLLDDAAPEQGTVKSLDLKQENSDSSAPREYIVWGKETLRGADKYLTEREPCRDPWRHRAGLLTHQNKQIIKT